VFKVYLFSDFHHVTPEQLRRFSKVITPARRDKANTYKYSSGKVATVISELLLRYALFEWTGSYQFELSYGTWGKPVLLYPRHLHFNISHCKEACVCVISDEEIGIDIEMIRSVSPSVIYRVCNEEEIELIRASADPEEEFIKRWVMKESYAKLSGVGLSRDFRTIDTLANDKRFTFYRVQNMFICVALNKKGEMKSA
jgi:4'-phosphopantetheinyl transferase